VVVELPGIDAQSVRVIAGERVLVIAGERKRPQLPGRVYQQMEIEVGPFQRQVRLVEDVDPERATARFENGVLTVELPVVEQAPPPGRYRITVERLD
jgi:HSP20 family protein